MEGEQAKRGEETKKERHSCRDTGGATHTLMKRHGEDGQGELFQKKEMKRQIVHQENMKNKALPQSRRTKESLPQKREMKRQISLPRKYEEQGFAAKQKHKRKPSPEERNEETNFVTKKT